MMNITAKLLGITVIRVFSKMPRKPVIQVYNIECLNASSGSNRLIKTTTPNGDLWAALIGDVDGKPSLFHKKARITRLNDQFMTWKWRPNPLNPTEKRLDPDEITYIDKVFVPNIEDLLRQAPKEGSGTLSVKVLKVYVQELIP
jgi:hypothetical protein